MCFDYSLGDCQSQPRAGYAATERLVSAVEAVEDVGKVCGVDAYPVIDDRDSQPASVIQRCREHDIPAGLGAMNGVAQDVSQCLAYAHPVEGHIREVGAYLQRQPHLSSLRLWLPAVHLCGQQLVNRGCFGGEPQLAIVCLRKRVQISYETAQPVYFLDDVIGRAFRCLKSVAQPTCFQLYDAEWRIELMRDIAYQPLTEVTLGFQCGGHTIEGRTHASQLI